MKRRLINKYRVIGLMSGTSLDGVDLACCMFELKKSRWQFSIEAANIISYSLAWKNRLSTAHLLSGEKLSQLQSEYGAFLGQLCRQFIKKNNLKSIDLIASHGHTIFHQPKNRFTVQLGDGNSIHSITGLPVVYDFRSLDVMLGGEGAPLVPIGDQLLFSQYDICLNLGGIANLSMEVKKERKAFDVCYCNMPLNYLTVKTKKDFDKGGKLASSGTVDLGLLKAIEKIYDHDRKRMPSLAREGFEKYFQPLLNNESLPINTRLRTVCESVANEIARAIPPSKKKLKLLVTGGGAHNQFLIKLIQTKLKERADILVPEKQTIDFKEALVFAFLGVLRLRDEINVLKSVTGAIRDSSSGVLVGA